MKIKGFQRVLLYLFTWFVSLIFVVGPVVLVAHYIWKLRIPLKMDLINHYYYALLMVVLQCASVLGVTWVFCKYVDKIKLSEIGLRIKGRMRDVIFGFIIGGIMITSGVLIINSFYGLTIDSAPFNFYLFGRYVVLYFIAALTEEIMVRGYVLRNLILSFNKYIALIVSAILFSVFHLGNHGINLISILNLFLSGLLLGICYLHSLNLWFPIALHFSWNFFQGPVWGFNVSGIVNKGLLFQVHEQNIELSTVSGGRFGFEGSVICTSILIISFIVLCLYFKCSAHPKVKRVYAFLKQE